MIKYASLRFKEAFLLNASTCKVSLVVTCMCMYVYLISLTFSRSRIAVNAFFVSWLLSNLILLLLLLLLLVPYNLTAMARRRTFGKAFGIFDKSSNGTSIWKWYLLNVSYGNNATRQPPPHPTPGQKKKNNVIVFKCFFLNASQGYII